MKEIKFFAVIAALAVAATVLFPSCENAPSDPARRALFYSVKALGGMEKTTGWKSRTQKGVLSTAYPGWGNLKAEYTVHVKKPSRIRIDQDFSAYDHPFYYTYYGNGDEVWAVVNLNVRQHERYTSMIKETLRTIDGLPYYYSSCDTVFISEEDVSDSLVAGLDIKRIGCVSEGDTTFFDLNSENHLPVREIDVGESQQLLMKDYRETDGIMVPYKIVRYDDGRLVSILEFKEIEYNVEIPDSLFLEFRPEPESD